MGSRLTVLVALFVGLSSASLSAQTPQCISLRIELQDEDAITHTSEISTPEGRATATVQMKRGDAYPTFYLDLAILDLSSGLVRVSIRGDRNSDTVVDEFDLQAGGETFRTATTPAFGVSALRVFERVGVTCRM